MVKDKNGSYITEYSVVLFCSGYYCVEKVEILEPHWVKLRNGCVHTHAHPEQLEVVN